MVKWETVELITLSASGMQNGVFYEGARKGTGVPLINVGDMYTQAPITDSELELFDATDDEIKRFSVNDGDLFFTRSSVVPSGIAFCNWYKKSKDGPTVFDSHVIRFKTDTAKVNPMYLYLQCVAPASRKYFISNAKTATMTTIDQAVLSKCPIPLPPIEEQQKIADALSDMDGLIASLEKLIAKKKAIKQGAMQDLLTGKKRLPGFNGEWHQYRYKNICQFINGRAYSQQELLKDGKYQVLRLGNLFTNEHWYYTDLELPEKQYCNKGDLIYAWSASFGPRIWLGDKVVYHYHIWKVHCLESVDKIFLYHYFMYDTKAMEQELQGGTMSHLTKDTMENRYCRIPDLNEQQAIASILSDMDAEIEALEQKLQKCRQTKQGMMQQLLTGKIRFV